MTEETALFRRVCQEAIDLSRLLGELADAVREAGLPLQATLAQDASERLYKLHHAALGSTQPIDVDPRIELHLRLPWEDEPSLSPEAAEVLHRVKDSLVSLTRSEKKVVAYLLARDVLD